MIWGVFELKKACTLSFLYLLVVVLADVTQRAFKVEAKLYCY